MHQFESRRLLSRAERDHRTSDIPKRTNVFVDIWSIGGNSQYWKDGDEFRPERFANHHADVNFNGMDFEFIPFGSVRRICPGMPFAVATIELALANLLYHFDWEFPHGTPPDKVMTEVFGLASRRKSPLFVHAHPHHGCI